MAGGRIPVPNEVRFTTWTLRYNQMKWVTVDGLEQHWKRARVNAKIGGGGINATTTNVSALTFSFPAGLCPVTREAKVTLDNQPLDVPGGAGDGSWTAHFEKQGSNWCVVASTSNGELRKQHGLQGPMDDAFMDSFIMVRPTGKALNTNEGAWTALAMKQAIADWRMQFRGEPRVVDDSAVTEDEIANSNLILWGDPRSNQLLSRIARKLPLRWNSWGLHLNGRSYSIADHIPVMIYPNPLNPNHYIVINSGFTFSEAAPTSNALQIPKLPDFAIFDLNSKRVVDAGFFDEQWKLPIIQ
jgi:hypothetical protein